MNSLYRQLNPLRTPPSNLKEVIAKLKELKNPQAVAEQYINNNPQIKSLLQAANGDPEKAFRSLAQQMNVDPDEIIKLLW